MTQMTKWLLLLAAAILLTAIGTVALWKHAQASEQRKVAELSKEALCAHHQHP